MTINAHEQLTGNSFALFSDVSLNPQLKLGIGACLLIPASLLNRAPDTIGRAEILARLRFRRFTDTSSTKLEIQTVLWALETCRTELNYPDSGRVRIYTDSQCVVGLPGRRTRLEANDFIAKRSGQPLANIDLYRALYAAHDELDFELIKVTGHSRTDSHNTVQRIFSYVDQEVRRALTIWMSEFGA